MSKIWIPDCAFDFQAFLIDWSFKKERAGIFADCGLGKTLMALAWAENVVRKTNKRVLILTPLAVAHQFVSDGNKFGIEVFHSRDGTLNGKIIVTNYERLHKFSANDFVAVVCDESSILKNFSGATRNAVVDFYKGIKYRLLSTATPSPNDYTELGNSVEALGLMRRVEMLALYFIHDSSDTGNWRLKGHAYDAFWSFVASWARAITKPSDLGFEDRNFILPKLDMRQVTLKSKPMEGFLFPVSAGTLAEQRAERKDTMEDRCEAVAKVANSEDTPFVAWCSYNPESEMLTKAIKGAVELTGSDSDDEKEEKLAGFVTGKFTRLVTKPDICAHGLNWQHCHRMSVFPSHSHEQFYQLVRRCWRFGQKKDVQCHIVTSEAESAVLDNLKRKEAQAAEMFRSIIKNMRSHYAAKSDDYIAKLKMKAPLWMS